MRNFAVNGEQRTGIETECKEDHEKVCVCEKWGIVACL